ncbi:MAG: TAXI family TRAP transporter solute-binding subunit [Rhodospirillaceae bacterium]|nr:TAXI family TRAP transporter solute-binding subunit [Rhodospirillales bacterium]
MRRNILTVAGLSFALCATVPFAQTGAAERHTLVIGSGEVTGYYFPAAGALCRVVNKDRPHGTSCAVAPSSGSAANVAALKSGEVDFAILQSRAALLATNGGEGFKDMGPTPELRAVMSLHGEAVAVMARQGSGIETLADLKGKRVNLGRPGSFQRAMAEMVLEAAGLSEGDLSPAVELDLAEEATALCEGNIDAAFFTGIHPMPEAAVAVDECNSMPIPIKAKNLDAYMKRNAWLSRTVIRQGTYEGPKDDIPSLQLKAVLATTTRVPVEDVYDVVKAVQANFPAFTRLHPVLKGLTKAETAKDGIVIKMHEGAEKFYGEAGLNK